MLKRSTLLQHCALALAATLAGGIAHADIKGSYRLQDGQQVDLFYRDNQHMRASVGDDKQLVVKGAETWVLKRQQGQWLALNAEGVGGILRAMGKQAPPDTGPVQLRALGRKEVVAGYNGEVYELSAGDKKYEVVLSDHPDVLALTQGWRQLAQNIAQNLGEDEAQRLQQALNVIPKNGGLLRQGDNLALLAIDKKVPGGAVDMPADARVVQLPQLSLP